MKHKIITAVSTVMLLIPWTILPMRSYHWALESPAAEIMISCYAAFMIFSGIFTILAYTRWNVKGIWMQVCTVINSIYAIGGIAAFFMMLV